MKRLQLFGNIASFFSVVLSMSIGKELQSMVPVFVLVPLVAFLLFLLIMNEYFKVKHWTWFFEKGRYSIGILIFTLLISVSLSLSGSYLWVSSTHEQNKENSQLLANQQLQVQKHYQSLLNDASALTIDNQSDFKATCTSIQYWKTRTCYNNDERMQARNNVLDLETKRNQMINTFNKHKQEKIDQLEQLKQSELKQLQVTYDNKNKDAQRSEYIFYLVAAAVLCAEAMIIIIQREKVNFYTDDQRRNIRIIKDIFSKRKPNITVMDVIKNTHMFHDDNEKSVRKYAKDLVYLLGNLDIIDRNDQGKNERGEILKWDGEKILKQHYALINEEVY